MNSPDADKDDRVAIRLTWRAIPSVKDGASATFRVSRKLRAGQIALLPPPLSVRQAQVDLSESRVGVVHRSTALHASLTLEDLLTLHGEDANMMNNLLGDRASSPCLLSLELMPAAKIVERHGSVRLTKAPVPFASTVKTRHMTSVQLLEYLRAHGTEPRDGLGTPRQALRELAADIEDGYR